MINEKTVLFLIMLNTVVLFLDEFRDVREMTGGWLFWIDYVCIIYFLTEAILKIVTLTFRGYWSSPWNRFDFVIVLASLPALAAPVMDLHVFSVFLVLRVGRLFRFVRLLRFIPNFEHIVEGVNRALRASVGIFLVLLIMNFAFALCATILFGPHAPQYFGDPLISVYSLFKVFTVEGWYDIPDALAASGGSNTIIITIRLYFIFVVVTGGILGLSLANAVFVDEMTADNTEKVEKMVGELQDEIQRFQNKLFAAQNQTWKKFESEIEELRNMVSSLRDENKDSPRR